MFRLYTQKIKDISTKTVKYPIRKPDGRSNTLFHEYLSSGRFKRGKVTILIIKTKTMLPILEKLSKIGKYFNPQKNKIGIKNKPTKIPDFQVNFNLNLEKIKAQIKSKKSLAKKNKLNESNGIGL